MKPSYIKIHFLLIMMCFSINDLERENIGMNIVNVTLRIIVIAVITTSVTLRCGTEKK